VNESIEDEGDGTFVRVTLRVSNGYAILVVLRPPSVRVSVTHRGAPPRLLHER
jgi:hypothetical protein